MQLNSANTWCTHTRNILHVFLNTAGGLGTLAEVSARLSKFVKPATGPRRGGEFAAGGFQLDKLLLLEFGLDYPLQEWGSDRSKCHWRAQSARPSALGWNHWESAEFKQVIEHVQGVWKALKRMCNAAFLSYAAIIDQHQALVKAVEEFAKHVNFFEKYPVPKP
jgi:hypothetical protein